MNTKNFRSMHIMHELPTNKANFLIKTTQDFNSSRHAAPHLPIVFTDISFYILTKFLLCYMFFKRSRNTHITFIFGYFTVYAYQTLNFYFKTRNHFRDEITRLVMNTRLITTLKNVDMFKIIEFYWFMHSAFCGWKRFENLITRSLEDGFVCGARFSKWRQIQNVAKCKY